MNRRTFLATSLAAGGGGAALGAGRRRPNIVLILADDMGFSDAGCFGGEIRTPNLDRLARQGTRFTQFYNCARCCPTRASLLTGLTPHQAGVGHMIDDKGRPGYRGQLSERAVTIAEALGRSGYQTAMSGKWHLSNLAIRGKKQLDYESSEPFWRDKRSWPRQRGFDRFFGTIVGVNNFYDPFSLVEGNEVVQPGPGFYYTDAIANKAVEQMKEMSRGGQPWFSYVAFTAPHWPLHALAPDIARYDGLYRNGWDEVRRQRYERLRKMGLIRSEWKAAGRESDVKPWSEAANPEWEARRMAVYAAQIDRMDQGIGRILEQVRRSGAEEDTLVMFLSDNGGCAENVRPEWYDIPSKTRAGAAVRVGNNPAVTPGDETTFQSYGPGWANASNAPFRLYKHWVHEGGISTPLIASWRGGGVRRGAVTHEYGHVSDIMASCLEAAGAAYPAAPVTPLEGHSLLPLMRGGTRPAPTLGWEHEGNRALRQGKWKLVSRHKQPWELFDMEADRTEQRDLAAADPERVRAMAQAWAEWAGRCGVLDWDVVQRL